MKVMSIKMIMIKIKITQNIRKNCLN